MARTHDVAVIGAGTLDMLPHNGAVVSLLAICGTTHKTVKRVVERHAAGQDRPVRAPRPANYEDVRTLVAQDVKDTRGRISAKAAAAQGPRCRVHRLGPQLPPPRGPGEEGVAGPARADPPAGVVVPG